MIDRGTKVNRLLSRAPGALCCQDISGVFADEYSSLVDAVNGGRGCSKFENSAIQRVLGRQGEARIAVAGA